VGRVPSAPFSARGEARPPRDSSCDSAMMPMPLAWRTRNSRRVIGGGGRWEWIDMGLFAVDEFVQIEKHDRQEEPGGGFGGGGAGKGLRHQAGRGRRVLFEPLGRLGQVAREPADLA